MERAQWTPIATQRLSNPDRSFRRTRSLVRWAESRDRSRFRKSDAGLQHRPCFAAAYGRYRARVLRTYAAPGTKGAPSLRYREPGLGVDIDLGGWQDGRRLIGPRRVVVDGVGRGLRYTNRFDMRAPEPVQQFEIPMEGARNATRVTLLGALVQVHGPWVIRFRR